jgi:hypothetical protein
MACAYIHVLCNITPRSISLRSSGLTFLSVGVRTYHSLIFIILFLPISFIFWLLQHRPCFWACVSCKLTLFLLSHCIWTLWRRFSYSAHQSSLRIRRIFHSLCLSIKPGNPWAHFQLWSKHVNIPLAGTKHHQGHKRAHITHFRSE